MFGQLVIGPPGSGKSTYCTGMHEFLSGIGRRPVVINLDPANDELPYPCALDIADLITCSDVMEAMDLGPNGGLMYCMDFLAENAAWLDERIQAIQRESSGGAYVLIDCPGQAELFTQSPSFLAVVRRLVGPLKLRLAAVHLVDAHHCSDPSKIISASLLSLNTMMRLELPHVNILSKIDIAERYGPLPFGLEFFARLDEPGRVMGLIDEQSRRHVKAAAKALGLSEEAAGLESAPEPKQHGEWDGQVESDAAEEGDASAAQAADSAPATCGGACGAACVAASGGACGADCEPAAPGGGAAVDAAAAESEADARARLAKLREFLDRRRGLNSALLGLVDEFGLVGFRPLNVMDKDSVIDVTRAVDKANGYTFGALHDGSDSAIGAGGADWAPRRGVGSMAAADGEEVGVRGVIAAEDTAADTAALSRAAALYLGKAY
ncbi:hypothetical protein FNF28_07381 [Cafeteria roenbergensis]|uniref:GPN-loop GTPase 2 n=1 Tax=Cafeteria roenbergensis TaxID=33653 RepID=A0A5A8C801_CAFRO|nr:hypothetical protein FNF28_07381 [Cafeteria roenbergensis]